VATATRFVHDAARHATPYLLELQRFATPWLGELIRPQLCTTQFPGMRLPLSSGLTSEHCLAQIHDSADCLTCLPVAVGGHSACHDVFHISARGLALPPLRAVRGNSSKTKRGRWTCHVGRQQLFRLLAHVPTTAVWYDPLLKRLSNLVRQEQAQLYQALLLTTFLQRYVLLGASVISMMALILHENTK